MGNQKIVGNTDIVLANTQREEGLDYEIWPDGVRRVRDTDLGSFLKLGQPRDIRKNIHKNQASLEIEETLLARLAVAPLSGPGGHRTEVTEYWLTVGQMLILVSTMKVPAAVRMLGEAIRILRKLDQGITSRNALVELPRAKHLPLPDFDAKKNALEWALKMGAHPAFIAAQAQDLVSVQLGVSLPSDAGDELLEVSGYLERKGLSDSAIRLHASTFGKTLVQKYINLNQERPKPVRKYVNGANRDVCGYTFKDLPLFEETFEEMRSLFYPRLAAT